MARDGLTRDSTWGSRALLANTRSEVMPLPFAPDRAGQRSARAYRVLVVEDDAGLRELLVEYLEEDGFVVDAAAHGQAALACMRRVLPDVVILDLALPFMDGRTFAARCRQDPWLTVVPIVLLSAQPDLSPAVEEVGARAGLAKPLDLDVLLAVIQRVTRT